jgi:hypothetical protein
MAVELNKTFSVNIGAVVDNSISAVQAIRRMRYVEMETLFQQQVAEGLSYDGQIAFLENQLKTERETSFQSPDLIGELEKRIADTKRLKRFNNYRTKYQDILQELKAGKANAKEQLSQLKGLLNSAGDDAELRLEIEGDITTMEQQVKEADDAMVQNQLKRAQYDGTEKVLSEAIALVKDKRSKALFEGLDDEASAYDTWLTVLNKQLNETRIVNTINDIDVKANTKGLTARGKLDELNAEIRKADRNTPIVIDGVTYNSTQEYWTNTRDAYLAGTGSGLFSDFFREIDGEYTERINAAVKRDGLVTTVVFDRIHSEFADLKNRTELQPHLERVQNYEALIQGTALESTANSIIDRVSITGDYRGADQALQMYQNKYGANADAYRLRLSGQAEQQVAAIVSASGGAITPDAARAELGVSSILTPSDPGFQVPGSTTPATDGSRAAAGGASQFAGAAGFNSGSVVDFLRQAGQDSSFQARKALAEARGITNYTGSAAQNTQLLNRLRTEAVTPPPREDTTTPAPSKVEAPEEGSVPPARTREETTVAQEPKKQTTPTPAPAPAPKPTQTPQAPQTPAKQEQSVYSGGSIVDYLGSVGQDKSYAARQKLAAERGIVNYTGSAEQNTELLKKLRGF